MEPTSRPLSPEALLAHAGWLRRLAVGLVGDPATADDVVQETWIAALRRPPEARSGLEPWLARVARNLAFRHRRGQGRRAEHELAAGHELGTGSPEALPTPAQTVERLDLQRTVVEAVLAIDEPFRTTIVQRYLEGRSSAEIARAFGLPEGTVRWRVKRGLEALRTRLDGRFGSRASWSVPLLPHARLAPRESVVRAVPSATTPILSTVMAMSATQVTTIFAGLLLVTGGLWWGTSGRGAAPEEHAPAVADAVPAELRETSPLEGERIATSDRDEASTRTTVETSPVPPAPTDAPAPRRAWVEARFVDALGAPWPDVQLEIRPSFLTPQDWGRPVRSDADGRARLEVTYPAAWRPGFVSSFTFVASRDGCTTVGRDAVLNVGETTYLGDIVLAPAVRLIGRVVDPEGVPVRGTTVGLTDAELPPEDEGFLARHGSEAFGLPSVPSAEDGAFVLGGVGVGSWRLWSHAPESRYVWSTPLEVRGDRDLDGLELVLLPLAPTDRIEGHVVDEAGRPVQVALTARVHADDHSTRGRSVHVDEQGRFSILVFHDSERWDLSAFDMGSRFAATRVDDVRPGTLDVEIRMPQPRWHEVTVRDTSGRPVEGAAFECGMDGFCRDLDAEATGAGSYGVPLPAARFSLTVTAPGHRAEFFRTLEPEALPEPFPVTLRPSPVVRGQVLANGEPVEDALVELRADQPEGFETVNGYRCVIGALPHVEGRSDEQGRFELTWDQDEFLWIRVTAPGRAPAELGPFDPARLASSPEPVLELTDGGAIEGRVLAPAGTSVAGTLVAINHGDGDPRTVRVGADGRYRFERLAPGPWQVLVTEVEVDPTTQSYTSAWDEDPVAWSCEVRVGETTTFDLHLETEPGQGR